MNKKQLDSLSCSLSKAINPAARKIEATAKILRRVEPLAILSKASQDPINPLAVRVDADVEADSSGYLSPGDEFVSLPVENTPAKMTTVAKTEESPTPL